MFKWHAPLWVGAVLLALIPGTHSSHGDDLYAFSDCVYQCEQITCHNNHYYEFQRRFQHILRDEPEYEFKYYNGDWQFSSLPLPKHLTFLGWDCQSNCDYECQRIIHGMRKENNEELYQFHGKWPFWRIYGIQEFVSVIFSIGNFVVNFLGFQKIWRALRTGKHHPDLWYAHINMLVLATITMAAWTFSTIFHVRDYEITEKLDYYFAGLTVLSGFHFIVSRLSGILEPGNFWNRIFFTLACVLAYAGHVYKLVSDWSYTYNMQANIAVGVLQNGGLCLLVYQLYSKYYEKENAETDKTTAIPQNHLKYISIRQVILPSFFARSPKLYSLYPVLLSTIVVIGMSLEVFDFPPFFYDLVDAHALWHLVTIFPAYYGWYDWMLWDINENILPEEKKKID